MDNIDILIIDILQRNARVSISEISQSVNLSVSAVSERLRKLENSGYIKQYTTILDSEKLQKDLMVIMFVSLERSHFSAKFQEFVENEDDVIECHYLAGSYDYSLKIITRNTLSLQNLMNTLKSLPGIRKTQTNVILSTMKKQYSVKPKMEDFE